MKISRLIPILVFPVLLSISSCSSDSIEDEAIALDNLEAPDAKPIEIEILELINAHRITNGLGALQNNTTVKAVAFTHTDYMIEVDNVSHDNFYQRRESLQSRENARSVSENVAYGYTSAESVVNAWLNSPGHRDTIEGHFTHFDISAEQDEDGSWYYTNIFITR